MSRLLGSYDFRLVDFIFDGIDIGGYGTEGGIDVAWGADAVAYEVGADGSVSIYESNDSTAVITVTVKETQAGYKDLFGIWKRQKAQDPKKGSPLLIRDRSGGDELRDGQAVVLSIPTPSKAKAPGDRVFTILCPYARDTVKLGHVA